MLRSCFTLVSCLLVSYTLAFRAPFMRVSPSAYIDQYKESALQEMMAHGVPASITLGQAMVESDFGNSDLAVYANNHFGLKCHKEWNGETYSYDDDAAGECFRKYEKGIDSYFDHSLFIKTRSRYKALFDLSLTDYKAWAKGLKGAGYATHPEYAQKVIEIIEKYRLYELDQNGFISSPEIGLNTSAKNKELHRGKKADESKHEVEKFNSASFIIVKKGDTYVKIAREFDLSVADLLRYNDYRGKNEMFEGSILFITPRKSKGVKPYHIVAEGETMKSIAQLNAIELQSLYKLNGMKPRDKDPQPGTKLYLRWQKPGS